MGSKVSPKGVSVQEPLGQAAGAGEIPATPSAPLKPARRPGARHFANRVLALRLLVVFAFALIWELVSRFEVLDPREFPPITEVVGRLITTLTESSSWSAIFHTVSGWAIAMVISTVVGVVLALVIGSSGFLTRSTSLLIDFLRSTPAPAIIFVLILLFGTGTTMKVVLVVFAALFPILIQSMYGVRAIDSVLKDLAVSYRLTRRDTFLRVRLPAAMPYIGTGVRISASLALIVTVVAEYLGGAPGLGNLVEEVRAIGDYTRMYALILLVGFISVALNLLVRVGESRLLHWHPTYRKVSS
jgi:ABC-type nitrate/sulfonate/bicarbonate transport system permease component